MREKLKTLPLTELKAIAKAQGMKGISTMRKNDLIDLLCERAKEMENSGQNGNGQAETRNPEPAAPEVSESGKENKVRSRNSAPGRRGRKPGTVSSGRNSADPGYFRESNAAADLDEEDSAVNAFRTNEVLLTEEDDWEAPAAVTPQGKEAPDETDSILETAAGNEAAGATVPAAEQSAGAAVPAAGQSAGATVPAAGQSAGATGSAAGQAAGPAAGQSAGPAVSAAGQPAGPAVSAPRSDTQRESFRRNDGQSRGQRPMGRPVYGRQPYGYSGGTRSDVRPMNTRQSQEAPARQEMPARQEPVRPATAQEAAQPEPISRPDGPRVPASSITPQIQAQFPDQTIQDIIELDSGIEANGILEVMPDGFGFIRCENFLPGENDVYVAPSQIRRFNLKTGDILVGNRRIKTASEKFAALLYVRSVNGYPPSVIETRPSFEKLTPIFPNERLHMETPGRPNSTAMRVLDLLAPIGKGQRGMIVSPPKAGKTTLLKQVAQAITMNHPDMHLIILLIDERPEEVTDIKESVTGKNVEVIFSTFDELPERHKRVSEMVVERARRLVEHGRDVIILLDSITRLARAYNIVVPPSGRTLSGGMDPAALHMPKRFFGAARNMREGGSLTILATALVNTGSRMDDVVYEEFKGTGNMELVLDRKLSEKRIFPAIDILKSGTRNDQLLLTRDEQEAVDIVRKATNGLKPEEAVERILDLFAKTRTNRDFIENAKRIRFI